MTKNPLINSLVALIYIVLVVFIVNIIGENEVNTGIAQYITPILVLSLFTLSAAIMGYIFCYQPLRLFLEGEKEKAVKLFIKTVLIFAVIIFCVFSSYYLIVLS